MSEVHYGASVELWSAFFDGPWPESYWQSRLARLPQSLQKKLLRYRRRQDRQLGLLGKLLLLEGLRQSGFDTDCLEDLKFSPQGRPFLPTGPDFNISHSGSRAVCAICSHGRVGIDLEEYRRLTPGEFALVMTPQEMAHIREADDPSYRLLQFWTAKESAAKAHGVGLGYDFKKLNFDKAGLCVNNQVYVVRHLSLVSDYLCCVATELEQVSIQVIDFPIGPGF
jgi:4'-phosphopantetheinyl transferase